MKPVTIEDGRVVTHDLPRKTATDSERDPYLVLRWLAGSEHGLPFSDTWRHELRALLAERDAIEADLTRMVDAIKFHLDGNEMVNALLARGDP